MAKRDTALIRAGDVAVAIALLTRLPVSVPVSARGADAAWAWPVAGLLVGLIAAGTAWLAGAVGLPASVVSGLALAVSVVVTGALHEDGLADVADGFWGGFDPARRLEIMRDSRIGSYGVVALILSLGLRWAALTALVGAGAFGAIVAAAVVSRAPMAAVMRALPPARGDGLSRQVGRPQWVTAVGACGVALLLGWAMAGPSVLMVAVVLLALTVAAALVARAKIGGQTGDVLGAVQQLSEIAALATLAAWL